MSRVTAGKRGGGALAPAGAPRERVERRARDRGAALEAQRGPRRGCSSPTMPTALAALERIAAPAPGCSRPSAPRRGTRDAVRPAPAAARPRRAWRRRSRGPAGLEPAGAPARPRSPPAYERLVGQLLRVPARASTTGPTSNSATSATPRARLRLPRRPAARQQRRAHDLVVRRDRVLDDDAVGQRMSLRPLASAQQPAARHERPASRPRAGPARPAASRARSAQRLAGCGAGARRLARQPRGHAVVADAGAYLLDEILLDRDVGPEGRAPWPSADRRRARRGTVAMLDRASASRPASAERDRRSPPAASARSSDSVTRRGCGCRG